MPQEMVAPMNKIASTFLMDCLRNSQDENFDHLIISTIKMYAFDEAAVDVIKQGMLSEDFVMIIEGKENPIQLNFKEKVYFVKLLSSSPFVTDEERYMI